MTDQFIDVENLRKSAMNFQDRKPFPYMICDGFFRSDVALKLSGEFPDFHSPIWHEYNNAIEQKKVQNDWNRFPPLTYKIFQFLNSLEFTKELETLLKVSPLFPDSGLNGGGWHIHGRGGKLNVHLDYSIHPKLNLERKLNILVYMNPEWRDEWGGHLGLWYQDEMAKAPGVLARMIEPRFNRAVLFDTTQNSWHGLPEPILCPEGQYRKSLAVYYLTTPSEKAEARGKALFSPYKDQASDPEVLDLIERRSKVGTASDVYVARSL